MSIRFQADADLNHSIVTAVRRREPAIDFASATDTNLDGIADPEVLEIAARAGRILVTHDRRTMIRHALDHIASRSPSSGIIVVPQFAAIGEVADALVLIWSASHAFEWRDRVVHVPSLTIHVFGL